MRKWSIALGFVSMMMILGCGPRYQIVPGEDAHSGARLSADFGEYSGESRSRAVSRTWEQLNLSARPVPRSALSSEIRRKFTVFELVLSNQGDTELQVFLDQFALVDSNQNQRSPIPPEEVDRATGATYFPSNSLSLGFGYGRGRYRGRHHAYSSGYSLHTGFPLYSKGTRTFLQALQSGKPTQCNWQPGEPTL